MGKLTKTMVVLSAAVTVGTAHASLFSLSLDATNCVFCSGALNLTHDRDAPGFEFTGLQAVTTLNTIPDFMSPVDDPLNQLFQYQVAYSGSVTNFRLFDGAQKPGFQVFEGELEVSISTVSEDEYRITIRETRQGWSPDRSGFQEVVIQGTHDRLEPPPPCDDCSVPEPATLALVGAALLGVAATRRCKVGKPILRDLTMLAVLLAGIAPAQAALVSANDSVFGAGSITIDTATGLEWLDLTKSTDLSFNSVSSQFGLGGQFYGFRYAINSEISNLWINAGIIATVSPDGFHVYPDPSNVAPIEALQVLIGITFQGLDVNTSQAISGSIESLSPYPHVLPYLISSGLTSSFCCDGINLPGWGGDEHSPDVGSWLVRGDPPPPDGDVPEPATLALVAAALLGVAATRRGARV